MYFKTNNYYKNSTAIILYFLYTIKKYAAQNFKPEIVSILHSKVGSRIGLDVQDRK